ncbi:hypothetical protein K8R33_02820 [archaeon]|nr:hypothetical protein [archaeon]
MNILDYVARAKLYMGRTMGYINILNQIMLLFLVLSNLNTEYGFNIRLSKWMIPIIITWTFFLIIFGYFDTKFGMWSRESKYGQRQGYIKDIFDKLEIIEEKLKNKR